MAEKTFSKKKAENKKAEKPHNPKVKFIWIAVSVVAFAFGIIYRTSGGEIANNAFGYVLKILYAVVTLFPGLMAAQQSSNERINEETQKKNIGAYFLYYLMITYLVAAVFVTLWVVNVFYL